MVSDDIGRQLHDRFTRGKALMAEEQAQLEKWYAQQDRAEISELGLAAEKTTLSALRSQVDAALAQLSAITKRILDTTTENEALRREIAALRQQLAHLLAPLSA